MKIVSLDIKVNQVFIKGKEVAFSLATRVSKLVQSVIESIKNAYNYTTMSLRGVVVKIASQNDYLKIVKVILERGPISQNARGKALIEAARGGYLDVINTLLRDGAHISNLDRGQAVELLDLFFESSVFYRRSNCVSPGPATRGSYHNEWIRQMSVLLGEAPIIPISDHHRACAIQFFAYRGDLINVNLLLAGNAQISDDARGRAVEAAAVNGHLDVINILLAGNPYISDDLRGRAIVAAAGNGHLNVIKTFLPKYFTDNLIDDPFGELNWHLGMADLVATKNGYRDVVHFLNRQLNR